ncbi:MAG: C4-type zinc ribbon domain-containing protein [Candidatus Omnitrophota bacterium]
MSKANIKEELHKLVNLQKIDKKVFELNREKSNQPKILAEIEAAFEAKKAELKSLESNKQKLQLSQKEKEGELAAKDENIKKSHAQLSQLKTNKEYQTKLTEIAGFKADMSLIEEDILKLMDEIDSAKKAIESEKQNLLNEEKKFIDEKNLIANKIKQIEDELSNIMVERKILADSVDKNILAQYEHILHGKDGLALVKAKDNSCQGCYLKIPHQIINEIKMHERLITCVSCARILFLDEDE